jgi:Glycosyltransferase family 87
MNRPLGVLRGGVTSMRGRFLVVTSQSERTVMLATVLLASTVSLATGYVLTQCYSVDVLSSLLFPRADCWLDWGVHIGRHCFGDYAMVVSAGTQPNPWDYSMFLPPNYQPYVVNYPAAGWIPPLLFGLPAKWLGAPQLGLIGYLVALTIAVISPAIWAARGARGLERVVVFVALGSAAIPVWAVIDRGNSTGFVVPIALVFFVALRRQRWALVAVMVVLAALVKPQFAVLALVLLAARQWRLCGLALAGVAISNIAAYLLWPRDFPRTIPQSIHAIIKFSGSFEGLVSPQNASFGKALLLIPDGIKASQTGGKLPDGFLLGPRSLIGYAVLVLVVVAVLALGRRIPPILVGIVLLATAALCPPYANYYYLVFVLPIAAVMARDPEGPPGAGVFEQLAKHGGRRRAVGICLCLAVALSIAQIAIPSPPFYASIYGQMGVRGAIGTTPIVATTVMMTPILWLVACVVIIVSYARRPVDSGAMVTASLS